MCRICNSLIVQVNDALFRLQDNDLYSKTILCFARDDCGKVLLEAVVNQDSPIKYFDLLTTNQINECPYCGNKLIKE